VDSDDGATESFTASVAVTFLLSTASVDSSVDGTDLGPTAVGKIPVGQKLCKTA
jgi:hypothetical protein